MEGVEASKILGINSQIVGSCAHNAWLKTTKLKMHRACKEAGIGGLETIVIFLLQSTWNELKH